MIEEYIQLCSTFRVDDPVTVDLIRDYVIPHLEKQATGWEHAVEQLQKHGEALLCEMYAERGNRIREALAVAYERLREERDS